MFSSRPRSGPLGAMCAYGSHCPHMDTPDHTGHTLDHISTQCVMDTHWITSAHSVSAPTTWWAGVLHCVLVWAMWLAVRSSVLVWVVWSTVGTVIYCVRMGDKWCLTPPSP